MLERVTEGGVEFETENLPGWKPARCSRVDWAEVELREVDGGREGVETDDLLIDNSDNLRPGGGGVLSRLSSVDDGGNNAEGAVEADISEWMLDGLDREAES